MTTLYLEVIACIVAAAVLGLVAGWFIKHIAAKRRLNGTIKKWSSKVERREKKHAAEIDELETRLQSVGNDLRELTITNRTLTTQSQDKNEGGNQARSDAIELNRKQAELQNRLQRIIRQKDREIAALQQSTVQPRTAQRDLTNTPRQQNAEEAYIDKASHRGSRSLGGAPLVNGLSGGHSSQGVVIDATNPDALEFVAEENTLEFDTQSTESVVESTYADELDATEIIESSREESRTRSETIHTDEAELFEETLAIQSDDFDTTGTAEFDGIDEATIALDDVVLTKARKRQHRKD